MRRLLVIILLATFSSTIVLQDLALATVQRSLYTMAVLRLDTTGRISGEQAATLTERLQSELQKTGIFEVMERAEVEATLQRVNFSEVGCSDLECAIQAGRNLGTQVVVNGSIRKVGSLYFIDVNMVHVGSGQAVQSAKEEFDGDFNRLKNYMTAIARKLIGAPTPGTVQTVAKQEAAEAAPAESAAEPQVGPPQAGGRNLLVIGLVAAGAVGAGVLVSSAIGDKNKEGNGTGKELPLPPGFTTP